MQSEWFATWFDSPYYHLLYSNRSYSEADAFINKLFEAGILTPDMCILDLACGRGRHSLAMHQQGAQVLGLDLSPNSIAEAKKNEEPGLRFRIHDMRQPLADEEQFDAVANLFTSFGYLDTEEENRQVLANVFASLKQGGLFVLDFLNLAYVTDHLSRNNVERRGNVVFNITKALTEDKIVKDIEVLDQGQTLRFQEVLHAFPPVQLSRMLMDEGFGIKHIYGNYQLNALEPDSPRCIIVAVKSMN